MQTRGVIVHELSALNCAVANSCGKAFSRGALVKLQGVSNSGKAPTDYAGFEPSCLWRELRRNGAFSRNPACRFYGEDAINFPIRTRFVRTESPLFWNIGILFLAGVTRQFSIRPSYHAFRVIAYTISAS